MKNVRSYTRRTKSVNCKFEIKRPLYLSLEKASKNSGRSLNDEMIYRLERSLRDDDVAAFISSQTNWTLVRFIHQMMTEGIHLPAGKLLYSAISDDIKSRK